MSATPEAQSELVRRFRGWQQRLVDDPRLIPQPLRAAILSGDETAIDREISIAFLADELREVLP